MNALAPIDGLMGMAVPHRPVATATATATHRVLSIDAWRNSTNGWDWNQWFYTGSTVALTGDETARQLLALLRNQGIITPGSAGKVALDTYDMGDSFQVEVLARGTCEPLLALEPIQ